ncbi:LLM class flavin-dependent oxidoreductase [Halorientalis litorea]|jgi:5,10-methylenetetrahydromethanopterin reductase|uniref:LLM class flavin-dependent oxidoreductase n=1 Tax=Halorientalis litorea TaxID=2931977 RepID=UPI001FF55D02|nr:LLM class flavin-dependent oxidoreductase [Halorientalis litorea]
MKPGLLLPPADVLDPVGVATTAESLGYGSVWVPELWGADAFVQLGAVADATDDVRVGTAIANVFSRSPAVLAMAAATVDRYSDGRMTLGTGVSTPKAIEDLHGVAYDRPVRRSHEVIEVVKAYLSDSEERVSYEGEVISVQDFETLGRDVPVFHAAMGPANRRVVARLADGWIPHNIPFPNLEGTFDYIADHAREADRDPADITVAPYVPAAVSDDDPDVARDAIRGHVAYYVGNGEGYRKAVAERFPDEADAVAGNWREGDRDAAKAAVTDEMVAALGVAGTTEQAREQLAELQDGPVDIPIVTVPRQAADLAMETVQALAPE